MNTAVNPLSLAAGTVLDLRPDAVVHCAADAGYPLTGVRLADPLAQAGPVAAALRSTGLGLLDVEVVRLSPGPLTGAQLRLADTAAELGARYLLVVSRDPDEAATAAKLAALVERLAGGPTRVALEFMIFTQVRTLADAVRIATAVPGLTVLMDPLHLHRAGDPLDASGAVDPRLIGYAQLCDIAEPTAPAEPAHEARRGREPPGHGILALARFVAGLPPGCPLSVEVQSDRLNAELDPTARAALVGRAARDVLMTHTTR